MVLFFGCKAAQVNSDDLRVIYMKKTPCMGTCPNYEISIFSNGNVVLNAKEHVGMKGQFTSKLSNKELAALINAFEENNFSAYENAYKSNRTDLPTTTVTFKNEEMEKTVVDYDGAPESLKELEAKVHALIEQLNWQEAK